MGKRRSTIWKIWSSGTRMWSITSDTKRAT